MCIQDVTHADIVVASSRTPEVTKVVFKVILLEETQKHILVL